MATLVEPRQTLSSRGGFWPHHQVLDVAGTSNPRRRNGGSGWAKAGNSARASITPEPPACWHKRPVFPEHVVKPGTPELRRSVEFERIERIDSTAHKEVEPLQPHGNGYEMRAPLTARSSPSTSRNPR